MVNSLSRSFVPPPSDNRDIALGQFMHTWSKLEWQLLLLFNKLTRMTLETASIIFAIGFQCSNLIEIFIALGQLRLLDSENQALQSLCNRYSKANKKRNRIVHGFWMVESDDKKPPNTQWVRIYLPVNPIIEEQIFDKHNQKIRTNYRFTLHQLSTTTSQLKSLIADMRQFNALIGNRFDSDKQDKQS